MKSTPSSFPFDTKFVIYKDRHLHIPKPNFVTSEDKSPSSEVSVLTITQMTKDVDESEDRVPSEKSNQNNKRKPKLSDNMIRDRNGDNNDLNLSLPAVKTISVFEE